MTAVELWTVRTADVPREALREACDAMLAEDERERARALHFEEDRHEYLVTRALARVVLGRALELLPGSLSFRRSEHGRPALDPPNDVSFNLTNTTELVALALTRGRRVGLDAEPCSHADVILEVTHSVFSEAERSALARLGAAERRVLALRLWTLKEAYIKARGLGLSLAPTAFELETSPGGVALRFLGDVGDDDASGWSFATLELDGHVISLCLERGELADVEIEVHRAAPGALTGGAGHGPVSVRGRGPGRARRRRPSARRACSRGPQG